MSIIWVLRKDNNYIMSLHKSESIFDNGQNIYLKANHTIPNTNLSAGSYIFVANQGLMDGRVEIGYLPRVVLSTGNTSKEELVIYRTSNTCSPVSLA